MFNQDIHLFKNFLTGIAGKHIDILNTYQFFRGLFDSQRWNIGRIDTPRENSERRIKKTIF
jgi:hypothetical protein